MPIVVPLTDEEILTTYPVMKQLRPHLDEATYVSRIRHLQQQYGYVLVAYEERGKITAVTGYKITESLAVGKFMYVDDLITDEHCRSRGYATRLFDWLEAEAARSGCHAIDLDSGVQRHAAHRFYLNRKMNIVCHHFSRQM